MNRITKAMLTSRLDALNDALDLPREPYAAAERDANGYLQSNAGTFVLDWAYGGVRLSRMTAGGGERDISPRGTTRECYAYVSAMLTGIALVKGRA
jgi:hypothetical protein